MKNLGIVILVFGLALAGYSLTMDVSVDVPARDYGNGIATPSMQVANMDKMAQRQNLMVFSGILSVVGAILLGFGSMQSTPKQMPVHRPIAPRAPMSPERMPPLPEESREPQAAVKSGPKIVSICPKCRHMGNGYDVVCGRCGAQLEA